MAKSECYCRFRSEWCRSLFGCPRRHESSSTDLPEPECATVCLPEPACVSLDQPKPESETVFVDLAKPESVTLCLDVQEPEPVNVDVPEPQPDADLSEPTFITVKKKGCWHGLCRKIRNVGTAIRRVIKGKNKVDTVPQPEQAKEEQGLQEFTDAFVEDELRKISCSILAIENNGPVIEDLTTV